MVSKLRVIFFVVFLISFWSLFISTISAQEINNLFPTKQAVIVNPIRGGDFWNYQHDVLDTPKHQYEVISKNNLRATWLVRYDALKNPQIIDFLKSLDSNQEIGIFLEVTPALANDSGVKYRESQNWHFAKSVLVIGYEPQDRKKMIDQVFKTFSEKLKKDPRSVGAWWIDGGSLAYMREKYQIEANLDVSDQFSTDQYQVWGQYFSTPFYPAKANALMPAQDKDKKIGVVTIQWAARDPFNGYGNGVFESTYSVQANDYLIHNLDSKYFEKLLDIYPQTTTGLENDFSWNKFGAEYKDQLDILAQRQKQNQLSVKTMADFSRYYQSLYPDISPAVLISANDPLGGSGKVIWYLNPRYRMGWFYGPYGSVIRDLRELNDSVEEDCLKKACERLNLGFNATSAIDEVNYSTKWVLDEGRISNFSVKNTQNGLEIAYDNQAGHKRIIQLMPNDIKVDDKINPVSTAILNITTSRNGPGQIRTFDNKFKSEFDWGSNVSKLAVNFIKFIFLVVLFFLIPGWVIAKKWLVSLPVGMVFFTLCAFLVSYLHLDMALWLLPIGSIAYLLFFERALRSSLNEVLHFGRTIKGNIAIISLIFLGSLSWLITSVKNGLVYSYGLGYWGPNGHDAIWHLALVSQLQRNFPPENPVFAGIPLTNYHYFFDLLLAKSGLLFDIDNQDLLFRFFPIVIAVLTGLTIFTVVKKLIRVYQLGDESLGRLAGFWAAFFVYFGGSFGWVLSYIKDKSFGGETTFWAQQATSTLLNPPFAISVLIFLTGFFLYLESVLQKKYLLSMVVPLVIVWGTLIEFKAYGGILVLVSLGLVSMERILKRDFIPLLIFIPCVLLSALVFLPNNMGSQSLLEVSPLWLVFSMITFQDRLSWNRLSITLQQGNPLKLVYGYGVGVLVFLIGNLGTRIISLVNFKDFFRDRLLLWILVFGVLLPMVFIQKGNSWNIVQFFYYSLIVIDIFAGIALGRLYQRLGAKLGSFVLLIIVLMTVPTTLNNLGQYLPERPPARLTLGEWEGLNFLKTQPAGTVMTMPSDEKLRHQFSEPVPLVAYTSTSYVAAFSNHPTFLEDTINLEIMGVDYKGRLNQERDFVRVLDRSKQILRENNIKYFYTIKKANLAIDEGRMGLKNIFENDEVKIYRVIEL